MTAKKWGLPADLVEWLEKRLPGGRNRALRYQLRAAARTVLAWDENGELHTVAPMDAKQEKAKDDFTEYFRKNHGGEE